MSNKHLTSADLSLLHALQYEIETLRSADQLSRWQINEEETKAVDKWMSNRIQELLDSRGY
jgi:hypothetical protein